MKRIRNDVYAVVMVTIVLSIVFSYVGWRTYAMGEDTVALWNENNEYVKTEVDLLGGKLIYKDQELPYDDESNIFYMPLDMDTEEWSIQAFKSGDEEVDLFFANDFTKENKQDAIREGRTYNIYAVKGQEYNSCQIVFTGLPVLSITCSDKIKDDYTYAEMHLLENAEQAEWATSSKARVKRRGASSYGAEKGSLKMELLEEDEVTKSKKSLLGMREDDDWILNSMYSDPSKVREYISYELWMAIGAGNTGFPQTFGTRMEYVELIFNGTYHGLYAVIVPIDDKMLDIQSDQGEVLYKKKESLPYSPSDFEVSGDAESAGGFDKKTDSFNEGINYWRVLKDYSSFLLEEDIEVFHKSYEGLLEVSNSLDYWVFVQTVIGIDNRAKNYYLALKNTIEGSKLFYIPWDLDKTFLDEDTKAIYGNEVVNTYINLNPMMTYMEHCTGALEYLGEKWKTLRSGVLSDESLKSLYEETIHEVSDSGAFGRDQIRWNYDGSGEAEYVYQILCKRMTFLDGGLLYGKTE